MRIILDGMGGDDAPVSIIEGAIAATAEISDDDDIVIVGKEDIICECLEKYSYKGSQISVVNAEEVITNDEAPVKAVRHKKDSSVVRGITMVKEGDGDVFISAGSTGAILAGGLLILGRITGIDRPTLAAVYPVIGSEPSLLTDTGANAECKAKNLLEFGVMGSIYMQSVLGRQNPTVGLVNNGTEAGKGTPLTKEAYALMEQSNLNFIGNVETRDLQNAICDVIVTDGFTGNAIVKLTEGMIARLIAESKAAEDEMNRISKEVETAMADYDSIKDDIEKANKAITDSRISVNKWDGRKTSNETILNRAKNDIDDLQSQINERESQLLDISKERNQMMFGDTDSEAQLTTLEQERKTLDDYITEIAKEKKELAEHIAEITDSVQAAENEINSYQDQKYQLEIKMAKNETQMDTMKDKLWDEFEISYVQAMDFRRDDFAMTSSTKECRDIKTEMRELGDINVGSIQEYDTVSERYKFLTDQRSDVLTAMNELEGIISDMSYAPQVYISVKDKVRLEEVMRTAKTVAENRAMRVSTGQLNSLVIDAMMMKQPPADKGKRLKIYYTAQIGVKPPLFSFQVNSRELMHFSYARYLENKIREAFGFEGTSIKFVYREKREKDQ